MTKSTNAYLSQQLGEHLVVAELARRGIVASVLSGNAPDIDILAFRSGKSIGLQVKAFKTGSVSVNLEHFLDIERVGLEQRVKGINLKIDPNLIFIIVKVGTSLGDDRFYVLLQSDIQKFLEAGHTNYMVKHNGIRPKNPDSMHGAYGEADLENFHENWALIDQFLPK